MELSNHVSQDAQPGSGGEPQQPGPGPTLGPHQNGGLKHPSPLNRRVDIHGRRREDDEVSLLASNEGIPDPPQAEQDLSQVCFSPVANVTLKWSPHEVIASCVSKYFGSKDAMSAQILEDHGAPYINNVVVPQIDQTILMAPKVQRAENV